MRSIQPEKISKCKAKTSAAYAADKRADFERVTQKLRLQYLICSFLHYIHS